MQITKKFNKPTKAIKAASFGGAFDIEDDQFFTREEINDVAYAVEDTLNEKYGAGRFRFVEVYMENTYDLELRMLDTVTEIEYEVGTHIDMRKIRKPMDIMKYVKPLADEIGEEASEDMKMYGPIESATNTCNMAVASATDYDSFSEADPVIATIDVPLDGIEVVVDANGDYDFKDTDWVKTLNPVLVTPYGEFNVPSPENDLPEILINEIYSDFEDFTDFKPGTYILQGYAEVPYEVSNVQIEYFGEDDQEYFTQDVEIKCIESEIKLHNFGVEKM